MQIPEISPLLAKHCKRFHVKTLDVFGSAILAFVSTLTYETYTKPKKD